MDETFRLIGKRINESRRSKHISQEDLAEMTGLSKSYIYKIEAGYTHLTVRSLLKITTALDVSPVDIFRDTPDLAYDERIHIILGTCSSKEKEFLYYMLNQYGQAKEKFLNEL